MHWFSGKVEPENKKIILNQTVEDFTLIHAGVPKLQRVKVKENWLPPLWGWLKVNTDASY